MGYSTSAVVWLLVIYGVMVAIGNTVGGRLANSHPEQSLIKMFAGLAVALASSASSFTQPSWV